MSIAPARRVSTSSPATRVDRNYSPANRDEQFVEVIDTNNNVSVRDDTNARNSDGKNLFNKKEAKESKVASAPANYVNNTIEALAASGVYEETAVSDNSHKVGVYDNNQAIIKDEELDRTGHSYLKHFYEKNEPVAEVDEFI